MRFFKKKENLKNRSREIDPDEILLDASNLPQFDRSQFEGRLERPISRTAAFSCFAAFLLIAFLFVGKLWALQIRDGAAYAKQSADNALRRTILFADRGVVYDRNGTLLAWNTASTTAPEFSGRAYAALPGLSHVVGFVKYPSRDNSGFYYREDYAGMDGVEKTENDLLAGKNGTRIVETDALGRVVSQSVIEPPVDGQNIALSIDAQVQTQLYQFMEKLAGSIGFSGGAAAIMDIRTGELLALVSYPEYDSQIMTDGTDAAAILHFVRGPDQPFLDRAIDGLYTPGSIVKPFVALAALREHVISPDTKILSTGSISIPNPFDPTKRSVFMDWRPQGFVDMRQALAVSSDVYFYEVGGGFENQPGLGIENIDRYMKMFGFGTVDQANPLLDVAGTVPSPEWKSRNFNGEEWRIGDTYNTSIGQYGFLVTPLQMARAVASIANGGTLLEPTLLLASTTPAGSRAAGAASALPFTADEFTVVREGMRDAVKSGTAKGLDIPEVAIGAKTGTAELGSAKKHVNSWVVGFFPYEDPHYAFAAIMERGPYTNTIGALYVMRQLFEWMAVHTPQYLK